MIGMSLKAALYTALLVAFFLAPLKQVFAAATHIRVLYPSFGGTWATPWIANEAGYFAAEGLDVELIRVGGADHSGRRICGGCRNRGRKRCDHYRRHRQRIAVPFDGATRDQAAQRSKR